MTRRDTLLAQTFVQLADTLVSDFDVVELLTVLSSRCVELFDASEAGIVLVSPGGAFTIVATSSSTAAQIERFEVRNDEGPCIECIRSGLPVICEDLNSEIKRYPFFATEALRAGFRSAFALPMRLRWQTIGALSLLGSEPNPLSSEQLVDAQALADVATIGLLQQRAADEARVLSDQLQYALESRVVVEQAKGVVARAGGIDIEQSFDALRRYARGRNQRLTEVAQAVVERRLSTDWIVRDVNDAEPEVDGKRS